MKKMKLKSCPFCGGEPRVLRQEFGFIVSCLECGGMKRCFTKYEEQVEAEWNHRTQDATIFEKNCGII